MRTVFIFLVVIMVVAFLLGAVAAWEPSEHVYLPAVHNAEATSTPGPDATPDWTPFPSPTPNDPTATPDF